MNGAAAENGPGQDKPGLLEGLRRFGRALGLLRKDEPTLRESLEEVIEEHDEEGGGEALGDDERAMLMNVLRYGELRVDDIMVPRADIVAIDADNSLDDLIGVFSGAVHSRLPVYRGSLDDLIGMVHVKDVVRLFASPHPHSDDATIGELLRPLIFVAPSMKLMDLLVKMRDKRTHMAIVVDEYGGTDGLVTIEDLVEQIVGEIEDEHDETTPQRLTARGDGVYDADARTRVEDLEEVLHCDLLPDERDEDVETVGGLVASLEGRVPGIGETIIHPLGHRFEILDADPRKILRVRIYPPASGQEARPETTDA
jgi:CBS domain containing-hemolysin-like protein